ncbi:MAG: efflux RND transporter periplasmic adaptor subunit [Verrucomicrobia bacterium]|nr:efflux RND transporter periplasmic adaptor subunit [Verrucomicrobiota bacterium]
MRLIVLTLLATLLFTCGKKEVKEPPLPKVTVATAQEQTMPYVIRAIGQVAAKNSVSVAPQVTGMLIGAFFEEGDFVEEGALLFSIDPRIYEAELGQAKGQLTTAQASLEFGISQMNRYSELLPQDFVSQLNFEQYVAEAKEYGGNVAQFSSAVDQGKVNLDFCTLRAPIAGKIGRRLVDPGNVVEPGVQESLVVINQINPIYVYSFVPERFLPQLLKYQAPTGLLIYATVEGEKQRFEGTLNFINNQISTTTGTLTVRGTFKNEERLLWPGQFCTTEIVLYEIPDAIVIPTEAVNYDNAGAFVFVVGEGDIVDQRRVELGQLFENSQVITSGIKKGEVVVTEGQMALIPKKKVAVAQGTSS